MTNIAALATKVREMRTAQKAFFKDRDRTILATSKKLEREVDAMVEEALNPGPAKLL